MAKASQVTIPEAKIRQVIWMLKTSKTKKACCEHLGIAYNTKRLDKIITDFHDGIEREKQLKDKAKNRIFTDKEKMLIAREYLNGEAQSNIAKRYFISPQRIKKILIDTNTPIRARGKNKVATVDHIVQDLETKFAEGDKVFIAKNNCFAIVDKVFDEVYLDNLEDGRQRYIEIYPFKPNKDGVTSGGFIEPQEGIHYEIYWTYEDGSSTKLKAMQHMRDKVMRVIEETGRESYRVWRDDDQKCFLYVNRDDLFPVKAA